MADRAEAAHQCAASASLASSLSDVHVLVVDDEPLSRTIVGNLLRKCDYQVTMVESASEAIRVLDENGSQFDLVLTDVMMPDVGGIGLLSHVQEQAALRGIPVIMMSANEHKDTVFECISRGAEDYLLKPVTRKEIQHIWIYVWRRKQKALLSVGGEVAAEEAKDAVEMMSEKDRKMKKAEVGNIPDTNVPSLQRVLDQTEDMRREQEERKAQEAIETEGSRELSAKRRKIDSRVDTGEAAAKSEEQMNKESNDYGSTRAERKRSYRQKVPKMFYSRASYEYRKFVSVQWDTAGRPSSVSKYLELRNRKLNSKAWATVDEKSKTSECETLQLSGLDLHILVTICDILSEIILEKTSLETLNHRQFVFSTAGDLKLSETAYSLRSESAGGIIDNTKACERASHYIADLLADICGVNRMNIVKSNADDTNQGRDNSWVVASKQPCGTREDLIASAVELMGSGKQSSTIEGIQRNLTYAQFKAKLNQYIYDFSREQERRKMKMMKNFFSEYLHKRKQNIGQVRELLDIIDSDITNLKNVTAEDGHTKLDSLADEEVPQSPLSHFAELKDSYFKRRGLAKAWDHGSEDKPTKLSDCSSLDILAEQIQRLKGPPVFKCIGRIQQCTRLHSSNMVSNIAFSKETDIFCTAGISRRVRLYRYSRLVATSTEESAVSASVTAGLRPEEELDSRSKLSAVAWSPYIAPMLATSSFEGSVVLWDTNTGQMMQELEEHARRVRSLDFCAQDPRTFVSGGEDSVVKVWSLNTPDSQANIKINSPVCSVQFRPNSAVHLAAACVDNTVQIFDLRKASAPILRLNGHSQTVASSKWIDSNHIVSSSTDGSLKLWSMSQDIRSGRCLRTYSGHTNRKNFVGLAVTPRGDFICGSENNCIYLYMQGLSQPIATKPFNEEFINTAPSCAVSPLFAPSRDNHFISAVCVKPNSNAVVAASSSSGLAIFSVE